MKQSLNSNSIPSIQIICLVMALTVATITQSGCSDAQPGSDANVSIEEGNGGNQENESVGATKEEWFQTESVDGGVAIKIAPEKAQGCEKIVIPSKIGGEPVVKINNEAFYQCSSLKSVVIPEGVKEIGDFAFMDCSSLTSVVIPEGVKEIGNGAFAACSSLTNVVIPKSVQNIGDAAFAGCSSLTSVVIPKSVTEIGGNAFDDCPAKLRVYKESYAEKWARDNNLVHETIEGNDGANNEGAVRSEESEPAPSAPNPPEDAPEPIEIGSEPSATEPAENVLREWTDSTGKYRIKATFEEQDGSNVKLRREDGKRIVMPISKLSDADRDYLDNL